MIISIVIGDDEVQHITKCTTAKEAWDSLEKAHRLIAVSVILKGRPPKSVTREIWGELNDYKAPRDLEDPKILRKHVDKFFQLLSNFTGRQLNTIFDPERNNVLRNKQEIGYLGFILCKSLKSPSQAFCLFGNEYEALNNNQREYETVEALKGRILHLVSRRVDTLETKRKSQKEEELESKKKRSRY